MFERRYVIAAGLGSAAAAAIFFTSLDRAVSAERWGLVMVTAAVFALFMAVWNGALIRLDSKQRTARNIVFENMVAEVVAVIAVAWVLVLVLETLRWQDLVLYTAVAVPVLVLVRFLTRKHIRGESSRAFIA